MILITGGAGYIGSHINKELNSQGYETLVVDDLSQGHQELVRWGKLIKADIGDDKKLEEIFSQNKIEAVFHFAAFASVPESVKNPQIYYSNNVKNTLILLNVMKKFDVKYLIFSSSAATFGEPVYVPIDELHPQLPINPYGQTKLMMEKICNDYDIAYGLKFIALRYFNASGADPEIETGEWHEPEGHLIPLILDAALGKRDNVKIFGTDYKTKDGSCVRDYIHVTDLADIHIKSLQFLQNGGNSQMLNLGNGEGFSVREVIEKVKQVTGKNFEVIEADRRPGDPAELTASSVKVKEILNWVPKYNKLETIIETAWKWHQKLYKEYKKI